MQELRNLAATELQGFIADPPFLLSTERVQGVNLAIDRYWLRSFRSKNAWHTEGSPGSFSFRARRTAVGDTLDFNWRPAQWSRHCMTKGYPKDARPVVIELLLRERPDATFLAESPRSYLSYPIRYEPREPCIAHGTAPLSPGDEVGAMGILAFGNATMGTVGGFLRDSGTGSGYLVTCQHVSGGPGNGVLHPIPSVLQNAVQVATVRFSIAPVPSTPTSKCNRVRQPVPVPDVALAELDAGVAYSFSHRKLGKVSRLTPIGDMTEDDPVSFFGASSGAVQAKVGSLNLWREIQIGGVPHCMGDMFTIEPAQSWYVRPKLSRPGDSGAWILNQDNGIVGWDGMLVGGDGVQSYCCFAELIFDAFKPLYPNLVLN